MSVGLVSFMLIGCAESTPDTEAESEAEAPSAAVEENAGSAEAPIKFSVTEAPTVKEKVAGLNPAHGQPGHDCDIAVGAPLDGSGGVQTIPQPSFTPNLATKPAPQVQSGAKGLNPAHGQPGHNCDIAVGAPL